MGVTLTLSRRQLLGAALFLAFLLVLRWRGSTEEAEDIATAERPLVLGTPEMRVASGTDTIVIRGPALFVYSGPDLDEEMPTRSVEEDARALRTALLEAEPALQEMGVRVFSVAELPLPLGIPPEVEAAAGPRLVPGGLGFLLAAPPRTVARLDRVTGGAALACAAARTFQKPPPAAVAAACR